MTKLHVVLGLIDENFPSQQTFVTSIVPIPLMIVPEYLLTIIKLVVRFLHSLPEVFGDRRREDTTFFATSQYP